MNISPARTHTLDKRMDQHPTVSLFVIPTNSDQWRWDHMAGELASPTPMLLRPSRSNTSDAIRATVFVLSYRKGKGHPMIGTLDSFLTSALLAGQRSRPCPGHLTPGTY